MPEKKEHKGSDLPIGEIFKKAWELFVKNINMFIVLIVIAFGLELVVSIVAMITGASLAGGIATSLYTTQQGGIPILGSLLTGVGISTAIILAVAGIFVFTWVMSANAFAVYHTIIGKKTTAWENYQIGLKKFWIFLAVAIIVGIIVGVGLVLLVVPGIILAIFLAFSIYLVAAEKATVGKAISRSFELAKKSWLLILITMIILGIIMAVLSMIPIVSIIASAFVGVFATLIIGLIYEEVK